MPGEGGVPGQGLSLAVSHLLHDFGTGPSPSLRPGFKFWLGYSYITLGKSFPLSAYFLIYKMGIKMAHFLLGFFED